MTRSYRVGGRSGGREDEVRDVVRRAQAAGLALVADSVPLADVDAACRAVLTEAGLAEAFVHGTGHGVGLDIHEAPALSGSATGTLRSGHVVTVEPGAYLAGLGGVRWEDTVLVIDDGHRALTLAPRAD
ncbi:MAG: peptidase M24 family protein, partial [Acidimicrobiaceae bacterium]|nr:peptidase M24 family protein [Acidimicrobiaceae bacterium]